MNTKSNDSSFTQEKITMICMCLLDDLSIQVTLVRGLLSAIDFNFDEVQEAIEQMIGISPELDELARNMPKRITPVLSQGHIAEIIEKTPDEFALFMPYLRSKLLSIGYKKDKIRDMVEDDSWATPNFSLPPNVQLPPPDSIQHIMKAAEKCEIGCLVHYFRDESRGCLRVAAKAPPPSQWKSASESIKSPRLFSRDEKIAYNIGEEIKALNGLAATTRYNLHLSGMAPDEFQEVIAKFSWAGPKYGVRSGASKTKAQSVA